MPATLLRRSLEDRSVTEDAGRRIQDWIASRSPDAVFGLSVVACFVTFLVFASAVWSSVRRCRSSLAPADRWHRLPDGSTIRPRDGAYTGPVGTIIREGGGAVYAPARVGQPTTDMRQDAYAMSGRYGAYDPPPMAGGHSRGFFGPLGVAQAQQATRANMRVQSVRTVDTDASEQTKVGDDELKFKTDQAALFLPAHPPPPPVSAQNSPAALATPPTTAALDKVPLHSQTPSISKSLVTAVNLPLPGSPRGAVQPPPPPASGEAAFSTPKPPSTSSSTPIRPTHTRGASSTGGGFTPVPLALSSAASTRSLSGSSAISGPEPPKVELKRTWSVGTWIPQLKERGGGGGGASGAVGGDEEERAGLVARG